MPTSKKPGLPVAQKRAPGANAKSRRRADGTRLRGAAETQIAEAQIDKSQIDNSPLAAAADRIEANKLDNTLRLMHELQVHRVELELQNDALRAANTAIAEDLACFSELGELGPVGYFSLAFNGSIMRMNLAGAGLLGVTRACASQQPLRDYIAPASRAAFDDFICDVLTGEGKYVCEIDFSGPNHSPPVSVQIEGMADPARHCCHLAAINITARKQAERALEHARREAERANESKSRFLAAASHDLRQPLTALGLYIGTLNHVLEPKYQRVLTNMGDCVSSLNRLLTNLLDLSKLEAGVITPNLSDFAVDEVVSRVLSGQRPQASLKGLRLRHATRRVFTRCDPALLESMILNLVSNAVRYTHHGGVLVGYRTLHGKSWLEVWDTGIGIPSHMNQEIFEEFRQLGNSKDDGASGLGLAIVARTAALLGLQVRVSSREGKGSLFAIELPPGRASRAQAPAPSVPRRKNLCIALVDDNPQVLDSLECALNANGHHVVAATNADALVQRLAADTPDLVISDYRLEGSENGLDVIERLKGAYGAALPAILITGDTNPRVLRRIAQRGIVVQHKPLALDRLLQCVGELTERRSGAPRTDGRNG